NGNDGAAYDTVSLTATIPDLDGGVGVVHVPVSPIQNGAPDGLALVGPEGVMEFLSYEGAFTATAGPAAGMTSIDIGLEEGSSTRADQPPQRVDGVWSGPKCASFGALNDPFAFDACPIEVKIHEVQGSGDASPLVGARVIVEGIVVGD